MNKDIAKIITELEHNDNKICRLLEDELKQLTAINKKVNILWDWQFGKGAKLADDDITFPMFTEDEEVEEVPRTPQPVKRFKDKRTGFMISVNDVGTRQMFEKIGEELMEAAVEYGKYVVDADECGHRLVALEIADTITACVSLLNKLGYDSLQRAELYKEVNEKNLSRGYLD